MRLLDKLLKELGPTLLEPLSEQFAGANSERRS